MRIHLVWLSVSAIVCTSFNRQHCTSVHYLLREVSRTPSTLAFATNADR